MTEQRETVFKREYDRLINQPVNQITKLELEHMREYFRINGTAETEQGISRLEEAMLADEDKIDLYEVFQHGLNAEGEWRQVLNDFCVEHDEHSNSGYIQLQANRVLKLLEKDEEKKIIKHAEYLSKTEPDPVVNALKRMSFEMDVNTGSRILMSYCHLYRSFHCPKQKYLLDFLHLGYQAKQNCYWVEPFQLSSNYEITRRVVPDHLLTKELMDEETDRVIAEVNGYAGKYNVQLNESKFRPVYRYLLGTALKDEAVLCIKGDTTLGIVWLIYKNYTLYIGPDMFGRNQIQDEVEIDYNTNDEKLEMEHFIPDAFVEIFDTKQE